MKKTSKKSTIWQKYSKLIVVSTAVLLALGIIVYKSIAETAEIALITNDKLPEGNSCITNLARIEVGNPCGPDSFKTISFWCSDGKYQRLGDGTGCIAFSEALNRAQISCGGVTCPPKSPVPTSTPPPNPSPVQIPTPTPSLRPIPSATPLPSGCTFVKVQCSMAPCPDIIQCYSSPTPSPTPAPTSFPAPYPTTSPIPSSSPSSEPDIEPISLTPIGPGCYYQEPNFCIQLLGYQCKPTIVCPKPSPTAPALTAEPTISKDHSPLPQASLKPLTLPLQAQAPRQICSRFWFIRWCRVAPNTP